MSSKLEAFREETRAWLEANCPASQRTPGTRADQVWAGRNKTFPSEDAKLWFERMRDKGWTAPAWPREYGGGGLTAEENRVLQQELKAMGARTALWDMGLSLLGPALLVHASEAQKQEHVTKIARGEIRWCQGYSEPGAGSDLASLSTRAEDQGDHYLVSGTKIWTTMANLADWIFCLVRTDPTAKKQEGIGFLLIDMNSPGISVSPIDLISGESEFCQVFLDNVRVPKANMVGQPNEGWTVAKTVLKFEREYMSAAGFMAPNPREVIELARQHAGVEEHGQLDNAAQRRALTDYLMNSQASMLTGKRIYLEAKAGVSDARLALIMKYASTRDVQAKNELLLQIFGNEGLSFTDPAYSAEQRDIVKDWAFSKAFTVAGGTSEIQLNIIAKRALNLPQSDG